VAFGLPAGARRRFAVLSPHLDDAVLSLGASIAEAVRESNEVTVVTVFAGNPASTAPAGPWDGRAGFATAGEATRVRREEDGAACRLVGARPVWLPFVDGDYGQDRDEEEVWHAIAETLADVDAVLLPGRPLIHPDHAWLARLVSARVDDASKLVLYAELPYDIWPDEKRDGRARTSELADGRQWSTPQMPVRARLRKWRSTRAYASQLPWLARPGYRWAVFRTRLGHERIASAPR
jgi:LmbE family N-acetylglucosaminyl deacetylase